MNKSIEKKENMFINFLQEHNAYAKFVNNLLDEESWDSLDELCETLPIHKWCNCAFEWADTSDGFEYWNALSKLWYDFVKN